MQEAGTLFDKAYGELTVLRDYDLNDCWITSTIKRHCMVGGKLIDDGSEEIVQEK